MDVTAHYVSLAMGPYIIASFYLGGSIAAFAFKKLKIALQWTHHQNGYGYASISSQLKENKIMYSLKFYAVISALFVLLSVIGVLIWHWGLDEAATVNKTLLVFFVISAAFFYEILVLALLDQISREEKVLDKKGMVIRTYSCMAIFVALSLGLFAIIPNAILVLLITILSCFGLTYLSTHKRIINPS